MKKKRKEKKKKPFPLPTSRKVEEFTPEQVEQMVKDGALDTPYAFIGVPLAEREGVFIHSFMCNNCGLHFNVYSWKADKHNADNVYCPECGQRGNYRHFRAIINESHNFTQGGNEIYRHCDYPGSEPMSDSK